MVGDIGEAIGQGPTDSQVHCKFPSNPDVLVQITQVELRSDFEAGGCGYNVGDKVRSKIHYSHENLSVDVDDIGVVLGGCGPHDRGERVVCKFPNHGALRVRRTEINPVGVSSSTLPCGFCVGQELVSIINFDWPGGDKVMVGDIGAVIGQGPTNSQVHCKFPSNPNVFIQSTEVELRSDFEAGGCGYKRGDKVESLIHHNGGSGCSVTAGDIGEVLGGCGPRDRDSRVVCKFPSCPAVRIEKNQIRLKDAAEDPGELHHTMADFVDDMLADGEQYRTPIMPAD